MDKFWVDYYEHELSDIIGELLFTEQPDGEKVLNGKNFQTALDRTYGDERNLVIELFLRNSLETDDKWKGVTWEDIEPYKDILTRICGELGFQELQNPFLVFLPLLYKTHPNLDLTRDNMVDLNNLYATDELNNTDLMGKSALGLNHIIFNKNLYARDNVDRLVEIWNWLYQNVDKLNFKEIASLNSSAIPPMVKDTANRILNNEGLSIDEKVNGLFFKDGDPSGEINSNYALESILKAGAIGNEKSQTQTNKTSRNNRFNPDAFENAMVKYLENSNLSRVEFEAIIQSVRDKLGY